MDPLEMAWAWSDVDDLEGTGRLRCLEVGLDGRLWLGYSDKILSYDSEERRFVSEIETRGVQRIVAASNGNIYVTGSQSLWRSDGERWNDYPEPLDIPSTSDLGVCEDPQGRIWIASDASLYLVGLDELEFRGRVADDPITDFDIDDEGRFWVVEKPSGTVKVLKREGNGFSEVQRWPNLMKPPTGPDGLGYRGFYDIFCARDDSVWLANGHDSVGPKQWMPIEGEWKTHDLAAVGGTNSSASISQTSDGILRISGSGAIHRFTGTGWRVYRTPSLRVSRNQSYIEEGPNGSVWFLDRFVRLSRIDYQGEKWRLLEGLVFEDESTDGSRWFLGNDNSVVRHDVRSGKWTQLDKRDGLIDLPSSIFVRSDGRVWVTGSNEGIAAASVWDGATWEQFDFPELGRYIGKDLYAETADGTLMLAGRIVDARGKVANEQLCVAIPSSADAETRDIRLPGRIFLRAKRLHNGQVAFSGDDIHVWEDGRFRSLLGKALQSLDFKRIQNFELMEGGDIWVSNWSGGVARLRDGVWRYFGREDGMSSQYVADLLLLENGELAALTSKGLDRFDGNDWYSLNVPGLQGISGIGDLSQSSDGAIWVNVENSYWEKRLHRGASSERSLKTLRYTPGTQPPETEARLLSSPDRYSRSRLIGWSGTDGAFEGAALSLSFSYRLDDDDWSSFSDEKSVYLQDLVPGSRRVEVRSRDEDGNVDPTPSVVEFVIRVPFWETAWFLVSVIAVSLAIIGLGFGLLWQRIRHNAALDRMRLRFLTNISHELRSPLTLIMGPLEKLVSRSPKGSESEVEASMALRNAERLNELVDQLLELRKIEVEPQLGQREPFELVEFVRTLVGDLDSLAQTAGQRVEFHCGVDSAWVLFDKDAYRKILDNLVLNALKYSSRSAVTSVRLEILSGKAEDSREVRLTVSDEGGGISEDALPHIFEAFYSGKSSGLPGVRSFGVGLALVRELVDLNEGTVGVESPIELANGEKGGACFTVCFKDVALSSASEQTSRVTTAVEAEPDSRSTEKADRQLILVVDDEEEIRGFLSKELGEHYEVMEAKDGQEALAYALKEIPDLVLADVMMPRMSGIELCKRLRESDLTSHIPIILQTASTDEQNRLAAFDSGAVDFIPKPFSVATLRSKIGNLLRSRENFANRIKAGLFDRADETDANPEAVFVERVRKVLDSNLSNPEFNSAALASALGLGKSSCYRKFMGVFDSSPSSFLKNYRLEKSVGLLDEGVTASEVAVRIGYADPSSYNRAFKKHFGYTPANFKKILSARESTKVAG